MDSFTLYVKYCSVEGEGRVHPFRERVARVEQLYNHGVVAASSGRSGPALGHVKSGPQRSAPVPQVMGWSTAPTIERKTNGADVAAA